MEAMKANTLKFILVVSLVLNISVFISAGYTYCNSTRYSTLHHSRVNSIRVTVTRSKTQTGPGQLKAFKEKHTFHADVAQKRHEIFQKRRLMALIRSENPDKQAIDAKIGE